MSDTTGLPGGTGDAARRQDSPDRAGEPEEVRDRRGFFGFVASLFMAGGLLASYGTLAAFALRYLYSSRDSRAWQFVATTDSLRVGESMPFATPSGAKVVVARQSQGDEAEAFIALSSVCPHLGCQVHWESANNRFFCPCHNGAFDPQGRATQGPPAKAKQQLVRFPLKVEGGRLFIEVRMDSVTRQAAREESPRSSTGRLASRRRNVAPLARGEVERGNRAEGDVA